MNAVRPWRLLCKRELAAIERGLAAPIQAWQEDCLLLQAPPGLEVRALQPEDLQAWPESRIKLLDWKGAVCAQLTYAPGLPAWLQEQAGWGKPLPGLPPEQKEDIGSQACRALLQALLLRLAGDVRGSVFLEPGSSDERGNSMQSFPRGGDVGLRLRWGKAGSQSLCICLGHALVSHWCRPGPAPRGGLAPRGLPAQLRLPYRVLAGSATLPLAALTQMEAGDVLRLDSPAGPGLLLASAAGTPLCRAGLGLYQGRPALQLGAERPLDARV